MKFEQLEKKIEKLCNIKGVELSVLHYNSNNWNIIPYNEDINIMKTKIKDVARPIVEHIIENLHQDLHLVDGEEEEKKNFVKEIENNKEEIIRELKNVVVEVEVWKDRIVLHDATNITNTFLKHLKKKYNFNTQYAIGLCTNFYVVGDFLAQNFINFTAEFYNGEFCRDIYSITLVKDEENIKKIEKQTKLSFDKWKNKLKKYIESIANFPEDFAWRYYKYKDEYLEYLEEIEEVEEAE